MVQTLTTVKSAPIITQTKTQRSRRRIYLDTFSVEALKEHHGRQRQERLVAGPA